jgi:hypothetical protein
MISSLNPVEVPAVTYEYLFYPPSSDLLWPPAQQKAQGLQSGSNTPSTAGHQLWQKKLDMTYFLHWQMAGKPYTLYQI